MSLLMLQYCSALQICLNTLESEELNDKLSMMSDTEKPKTSGSPKSPSGSPKLDGKSTKSTVGGFVRRAGTTVKEKVTSMKRDFGRKGKSDKSGSPGSTTQLSNNNTALLNVPENDDLVLVVQSTTQIDLIQQSKSSENLESSTELNVDISQNVTDILTDSPDTMTRQRPDYTDSHSEIAEAGDSSNYSSEEILRYRDNSFPKVLLGSDSDSDSDYLLIDSTDDEPAVSDSSDNEATFPTDHEIDITDVTDSAKTDIDKHKATQDSCDSDPQESQHHQTLLI
ncbi:hypothetical protein Btru_069982 [Bulinus truncatus]|nr:hypothetical protein Btru_069982 [Bulinus truncatus]